MSLHDPSILLSLDMTTLFVVAVCVTGLLGLLLLFVWTQDRIHALAWWGTAYLVGGVAVVLWSVENYLSPPLPAGIANAMLFVACGMIWSAARLFHGRPVLWGSMLGGATLWLAACLSPGFVNSIVAQIVLSSFLVSMYTFLAAAELYRERRKHLRLRGPAIFVPILHGLVFLLPIPLATTLSDDNGVLVLTNGWIAVSALEVMLYVVCTAFMVLVICKEQTVRIHKRAATVDDLTGVVNRRGFLAAAKLLIERFEKKQNPVSVLAFDLDHFKKINDRFGHAAGDEALRVFATVAGTTLRATDIVGRLGGEEFVAILPGTLQEAGVAAERVRTAFEAAGKMVGDHALGATVSVGVASGEPGVDIMALVAAADRAMYKAKESGRNRVVLSDERPSVSPQARSDALSAGSRQEKRAGVGTGVLVPILARFRRFGPDVGRTADIPR